MAIYVSNDELTSLLESEENDTLEFKNSALITSPSGKNRYKIAREVVGFANHKGGRIVFGVNDEQVPEGENILESESLNTMSEIVNDKISPPVEFSYSYYSAEKGDISDGSVIVFEIEQGSAPSPHAITENSDGEIRKREFRIRVGESTRLVSNDELVSMFNERKERDITEKETIQFLLDENNSPSTVNYKPRYQHTFDRHFSELSEDDESLIEVLCGEDPPRSPSAQGRLLDAQYALTISSILADFSFAMVSERRLIENCSNRTDSLEFEMESLTPDKILLPDNTNPLIERTALNKPGILPGYNPEHDHFKIPKSVKVKIKPRFEGFDITNEQFALSSDLELVEVGIGLPIEHPACSVAPSEYGPARKDSSGATMFSSMLIRSEFKYPRQSFSEFDSYRSYCRVMADIFLDSYNVDEYLKSLPDKQILKLEEKIDSIRDSMEGE